MKKKSFISKDGSYMLISNLDKEIIYDIKYTHEGAFGQDHLPIVIDKDYKMHIDNDQPSYILVWKFPADFSKILTYPFDLWLNVGKYNVFCDLDKKSYGLATKKRLYRNREYQLHKLEYEDGKIHAAVTSTFFLKGELKGNYMELNFIVKKLRDICEINLISCHRQHHAIVFPYSPDVFASMLRENPRICENLTFFAENTEKKLSVTKWCENYKSFFLS